MSDSYIPENLLSRPFNVGRFLLNAGVVGSLALTVGVVYREDQLFLFISILLALVMLSLVMDKVMMTVGLSLNPEALSKEGKLKKWTEQGLQILLHVLFTVLEGLIMKGEHWWSTPETLYEADAQAQVAFRRTDLTLVYTLHSAFWTLMILLHVLRASPSEERRADEAVMRAHHAVTLFLVAVSWLCGNLRIGLFVLFVHDASDIAIDLLKMSNVLEAYGRACCFATEVSYCAAMISWVYWRLYVFPFVVLHATLVVPVNLVGPPSPIDALSALAWPIQMEAKAPGYLISNALLVSLFLMHIWWFYLLVRVGMKIISSGAKAGGQVYEGPEKDKEEGKGSEKMVVPLSPRKAWPRRRVVRRNHTSIRSPRATQ